MAGSLLATKYHRPAPAPDCIPRPQVTRLLDGGYTGRLILVSAPAGFGKTALVSQWLQLRAEGRGLKADASEPPPSALTPPPSALTPPPSALSPQPSEALTPQPSEALTPPPSEALRPQPSPLTPPPSEALSPQKPFAYAWLSLDADDNAPLRFWSYVVAALQTAAPSIGRVAQAAFDAPQPLPIEPVLTTLINDLARLDTPLLLVLDDYHVITEPAIHRSVDYLLEHMPASLRLIVITREDPPLALPRLRARGHLTEIRAANLRFTTDEAAVFLNTSQALALPDPDIVTLVERTEGWITGLRLAALSLQNTADRHGFVAAFSASDRFVTDYLVDEILSRQPAHRRAFLLQTAVLNRLCGPLCDAVLHETSDEWPVTSAGQQPAEHSSLVLEELERANLFLVPLDHERRWFRYHHLFAEFLRLRLREAGPERVAALYRRARAWCVAHGLPREALGYALAAGDHSAAADLLEAILPEWPGQEPPDDALRQLTALPEPLLRQRPVLCVQFAWALMFAGRMAEAAEYLAAAEAAAAADAVVARQIAGPVAAHRAYLHFFAGAFQTAQHEAQLALTLLPPGETVLRARAAVVLSSVLRFAGQLHAAEAALLPLRDTVASASVYTATLYYVTLGEIQQERGQLHQAIETFSQALAFAERTTGRPDTPFTGFASIAIGHVRYAWNDLAGAAAAITRGIALCREWRQADALAIGLIELAELEQSRGAFPLAQHALDELRQIVTTMGSSWGQAQARLAQARLDLARGDMAAVEHWVRTSGVSADAVVAGTGFDELQTFGQVLIARGDPAGAARLFERLAEQFHPAGCINRLLPALVWRARALAELGRHEEALAVLGEALTLGEPGGYVRVFVAGGPPVAALLGRMKDEGGRMNPYAAHLLAAFPGNKPVAVGSDSQPSPLTPQPSPLTPQPSPLTPRELAILRLMAAGLSNQAIGAELALSVNTVRWYASQLYAKLDVSGRGAAVARARALGLLP